MIQYVYADTTNKNAPPPKKNNKKTQKNKKNKNKNNNNNKKTKQNWNSPSSKFYKATTQILEFLPPPTSYSLKLIPPSTGDKKHADVSLMYKLLIKHDYQQQKKCQIKSKEK